MKKINGLKLEIYKNRLVNVSVGSSSLRNQGQKGIIKKTRKFLNKLNLLNITRNRNSFKTNLDIETKKLTKKSGVKFGAARKSLNIFLLQCSLDRVISSFYKFQRILDCLEPPLDSHTVKHLKSESKRNGIILPRWKGVKYLKGDENFEFQHFAEKIAKRKNIPRAYLDLIYWRNKNFD